MFAIIAATRSRLAGFVPYIFAVNTRLMTSSILFIRPPGTLVPKAFCFSRDVFFNQTQDLRAPWADRRETLHSDQHMRQLFNASPKIRGVLP